MSKKKRGRRRIRRCPVCRVQIPLGSEPRHAPECPVDRLVNAPPLSDCPDCGAPYIGMTFEHEDGCPYLRGVEAASDNDRQFFEDHPHERLRVRPPFPSEQMMTSHANPDEPGSWVTHVTVRKWNDEARVRRLHTAMLVVVPG